MEKKTIKSRIKSKYDITSDNNWAQSITGHNSPEGFIQPISQTRNRFHSTKRKIKIQIGLCGRVLYSYMDIYLQICTHYR